MDDGIPIGIGPHEGRELELMLAGKKPLAMFNDDLPEDMEPPEISFDPHVRQGRFIKSEIDFPVSSSKRGNLRYYFYVLPGEEWRIARLIDIQRGFFENNVKTTPELEMEIGRLLGNAEADIRTFIDRYFASEN